MPHFSWATTFNNIIPNFPRLLSAKYGKRLLQSTTVLGEQTGEPILETNKEKRVKKIHIPPPRGEVKSHEDFLKKIGRGCEEFVDKFQDWDHLFRATSKEMKKDLGLPVKQRRWICIWRQHYRRGIDPYNIRIMTNTTRNLKKSRKKS